MVIINIVMMHNQIVGSNVPGEDINFPPPQFEFWSLKRYIHMYAKIYINVYAYTYAYADIEKI